MTLTLGSDLEVGRAFLPFLKTKVLSLDSELEIELSALL